MERKLYKLISITTITVLVFHALSQSVYGFIQIIPNENKKKEEAVVLDLNNEPFFADFESEEEPKILDEDIEKREQNIKHFLTDKGTFQAVVYPSSVHYELDGKWEDIDNSLITAKNEDGQDITRNKKNSFVVEFSNSIKEDLFNKQNVLKDIEDSNKQNEEIEIITKQLEDYDKLNMQSVLIELDEKGISNEIENLEKELDEQDELIEQEEQDEQNALVEELEEQEKIIEQDNLIEEELLNKGTVQTEKIDKRKLINDFKIISIQNDKFSMKWYLEDTNKTELRQIDKQEAKSKAKTKTEELNREKTELKNISSAVTYSNIMNGIDLDYDITSDYVKETIVLKSKESVRDSFVFNMDMGDSTLILNEDNSIDILDNTGEKIAIIEIPYMFDEKREYSMDIKVKLEKDESIESNIYTMEIIPGLEWLEDEERVYPVKIDPTVKTSLYAPQIEDATIYSDNIYGVTGPHDIALKVGNAYGVTARSLVKFNLPTLSAADQVVGAALSIFGFFDTWQWWNPPPSGKQVNVHKVTSSWHWSTANWVNSANIYDSSRIVDFNLFKPTTIYNWGENVWDITDIAKDWYVSGNNYGLMIKGENDTAYYPYEHAFYISSKVEDDLLDARPMAIIEYRSQGGIEDYLSYHVQDVGRAGTVYTNDYNGDLTVVRNNLSTPGARLPVTVTHVFNSYNRDWNIGYGRGYRLNFAQRLAMVNISGKDYIKYTNETGSVHYFTKVGSTNTYKDEDGSQSTLTLANDIFTLEDKAGNKSVFTRHRDGRTAWYLKEIWDTNGNKITLDLSYDVNNMSIITGITDGAGDYITLNYLNNRLLSEIIDPSGRIITITYDSNDSISEITYPDGKTTHYIHGSTGIIKQITDIDDSYITYEYYDDVSRRVKKISEYSTIGELGNTLEIKYKNNTTTFTDNQGYSQTMTFNNWRTGNSNIGFRK